MTDCRFKKRAACSSAADARPEGYERLEDDKPNLRIPEYEAKRFEGAVKDGGTLVSVHCDYSDEVSTAKRVLKQAGGRDIASSGEETPAKERDLARNSRAVDPEYAASDETSGRRFVTDAHER